MARESSEAEFYNLLLIFCLHQRPLVCEDRRPCSLQKKLRDRARYFQKDLDKPIISCTFAVVNFEYRSKFQIIFPIVRGS